jgi:hypothetical protein
MIIQCTDIKVNIISFNIAVLEDLRIMRAKPNRTTEIADALETVIE